MQPFSLRPFRPAWWLPDAHSQTIAGKYLRAGAGTHLRRERVETPDGDFLDLDHAEPVSAMAVSAMAGTGDATPIVLVLHGLEGSTRSAYVRQTFRELTARGLHGVGLNFRSCGGEINRLPRFYHAGDTGDLHYVLRLLTRRFPEAPLGAVGFSLGGNVLLKYLGERGSNAPIGAAVAVSVPFDLAASAGKLDGNRMGGLYTAVLLRSLRAKFLLKNPDYGRETDRIRTARTFRDFDDAATAPLHGFSGVDEYYASSSSASFLPGVRVPTLLLHAADDPFLPADRIPRDAIRRNPCLVDGVTARGGHVGFIGGALPWAPRFWAEAESARFLQAQLSAGRASAPAARPS